eukprot:9208039-Lingulodinium_polyedra.AAC.1
MVDPHSERARNKKLEIENALAAGKPVLLQETHCTEGTEAMWTSGVFLDTAIASSPARPGNNGGPQGGVAILLPSPWRITRTQILAPGSAIAAWAKHPGHAEEHCFIS